MDSLRKMCLGTCTQNQIYIGTWVKFVRSLNFFITKQIPWCTESEDELMKQQGFCMTILVNQYIPTFL